MAPIGLYARLCHAFLVYYSVSAGNPTATLNMRDGQNKGSREKRTHN